jgi:hypothetical protein
MEIRGSVPGGKGSVVFWVRAGGVDSGGTNARNGGALAGFDCGLVSREDTVDAGCCAGVEGGGCTTAG